MLSRKRILFLLILFPVKLFSQDSLLTLQKAIEISLNNNYDIKIASNLNERQENDNTIGNAGMLPNIDARGAYTRSSNSVKQQYSNGQEVNSNAVLSTSMVGDLGGNWTIFDGFKMFRTKEKLSELSMMSHDQLKIQIENSLEAVITAYFFIVRQQQLLIAIKEELRLSAERVKISDLKMKNGSGSKLDWLQAKTEYNRQRSIEISLKTGLIAAQSKLNQLMVRDIETSFTVEDTVIITYKPTFNELKKSVVEQNNVLNFYKKNQRVAELQLAESKSLRWPIIGLNGNYIYSKNTNEKGFSLLNQQQGFNYGVTASIPLFNGFNINRQIKNSRLDVMNSNLTYESTKLEVNVELFNAWTVFTNNLELLQMEEENIIYAREVLSIANERYRVGVSTTVEQLEAQQTFEEAMKRLVDARFNAKISETVLRKLNGELVK